MKLKKIPYFLCFLIFALILPTFGGELSQPLQDILSAKSADETVKVIIKLKATDDIARLKTELSQTETLADRHRLAVTVLKDSHQRAQAELRDRLDRLSLDKKAANIKSYWIVNAVAAEITAAEIVELAVRDDIDIIYTVPEIITIAPDPDDIEYYSPSDADSVTGNLTYIKADQAHTAGYTGAGRLVCSFDTGVDGEHPALKNRWKGLDGDSAASWFFELDDLSYPHTISYSTSPNHGTHTMGIMAGRDESIDYTVGVAPGAKWISAAVIDISGTSILNAFEWAADPDGNPNTLDDVPDVINHSWGFIKTALACENVFFDAIDNIEMLGIVNIFAAGNTGADYSIYNPANRAFDSLDCFAVGNLNTTVVPATLRSNSSRGPSDCPGGGIKPNVVAPGTSIRSSIPNNNYGSMTGTSMAAPNVAGLVALLRQKNPNATVEEIKNAILLSTQSETTFGTLPNNSYGWGAIDCMAALAFLDATNTEPNVRVFDFDHAPIAPGDTVVGTVVLRNTGTDVTNISASLSGSDPDLTVISGTTYFGNIAEGDTVRSDDTIRVVVADTVTEGTVLFLDYNITGTGYDIDARLYFIVEPSGSRALATHNTGRVQFTLSNFGVLGLGDGSLYPAGGEGFRFNGAANDLWEGGLIIGNSSARVSSGVHTMIFEPDNDFTVAPGGDMQFLTPGDKAPQQSLCAFQDDNGDDPLNVRIKQESFSFGAPYDDFIFVRYTLTNNNNYALTNVRLGMFMDWDIPGYAYNAGGYESDGDYAWQAYNAGSTSSPTLSNFRGMKLIEGNLAGVQTGRSDSIVYIYYGFVTPSNWDGYTKNEKYASLNSGFTTAETYDSARSDLFQVMSAGPMSFLPGEEKAVTFAIMAGSTQNEIINAGANALDTFVNIAWAPLAPFCISPADTLLGPAADPTPTFTWTPAADANPGDVVHYLLQYDTSLAFDNSVSVDSLTSESYTPTDSLEIETRYYWRVLAYDQNGDTTYSSNVRYFEIRDIEPYLLVVPDTLFFYISDPTAEIENNIFEVSEYYGMNIPFNLFIDNLLLSPWLSLVTESGVTPAEIAVNISLLDLPYGTYFDSIRVESDTATNSPVFAYVELNYVPETRQYKLYQNYPNPFYDYTVFEFDLERDLPFTIKIYDISGRTVDELNGRAETGTTSVRWTPPDFLRSGIYLYELKAPNFSSSKKMILLK